MTSSAKPAELSTRLAAVVLAELVARGVRDLVVCPGSRSQALAFIAAEAEVDNRVRLHVRIDERSAGFFALGVARETGVPAAVIVTSGTAVANLAPAVLEAFHARVPLIVISADRPAELRGVRANQTAWRNDYLTGVTRRMIELPAPETDAAADDHLVVARRRAAEAHHAATRHPHGAGPVHLNIGFRDPLSGGEGLFAYELDRSPLDIDIAELETGFPSDAAASVRAHAETPQAARPTELEVFEYGGGEVPPLTVVVAGADAGQAASDFARNAGLPLLAEPSSGARFGREAIQHWEQMLGEPELASLIEQVIVFGAPTLTRAIPALATRSDLELVVIDPAGPDGPALGAERFNPGRAAAVFARSAIVSSEHTPALVKPWLGAWVVRDRALRTELTTLHGPDLEAARATGYRERNAYARAEVAVLREPVSREHLTEAVWLATWPHDRMVVAASRLIRVLNRTAAPRNIRVHANRGLSGIDGTVATALGVAAASQDHDHPAQAAGTTRVLIGDLALLHDAGSLLLPEAEPHPRILLIVGNDGGGTIFDTLEAANTASAAAFDRVMLTPQQVDLAALAQAYGWTHRRASTRGDLDRALTEPVLGPTILEVPLAR